MTGMMLMKLTYVQTHVADFERFKRSLTYGTEK